MEPGTAGMKTKSRRSLMQNSHEGVRSIWDRPIQIGRMELDREEKRERAATGERPTRRRP